MTRPLIPTWLLLAIATLALVLLATGPAPY